MPELPEVHTFQQILNKTILGQRIQQVVVHDAKILRNATAETFAAALAGRTTVDTSRIGKYTFLHLDNGQFVQFHFGMTGDLHFYNRDEEPPRFERFTVVLNDGMRLGYCCSRKFSRIVLIDDLEQYVLDKNLGEDALVIKAQKFLGLMEGKRTRLKAFLLDQSKTAGIGNLYADEICYQTKIHPASTLDALSREQKQAVFKAMHDILHEAVNNAPSYQDYPENWFWEKWRHEGEVGPEGSVVKVIKVAGRTTYYCEGYQTLFTNTK